MSTEGPQPYRAGATDPVDRISDDGLVVRQVQWAWIWSSIPWLILAGVLLSLGFLEELLSC